MTEHEERLTESADNWRERCLKAEQERDAEQTRVLLLGQTITQLQVERDAALAALRGHVTQCPQCPQCHATIVEAAQETERNRSE